MSTSKTKIIAFIGEIKLGTRKIFSGKYRF
jgi:hypothetical protein